MATDSARPPLRIWQLPTFLLGLTAVWAAVTYVTPPSSVSAKLSDKLEALATALDRKPVDVSELEPLVRMLADSSQQTPRSHYLLGSGYVAIANQRPTEAADLWKLALQHFEFCDANTLNPQDASRMEYRVAKAKASVNLGDPTAVMAVLMNSPPGEDRSEVSRLLAECALRLPKPDLARARDELTNYLAGQNRCSPAAADRCKLKLAELNTALNAPDKARKWLKDISASAPADVLATAKVSLARQALTDKNWAEAVTLLEAAHATPGLPSGEKAPIRFQIGEALVKMGNGVQAVPYFEQVSREPGALGGQASLRMAELRVLDPHYQGKRGESVDWLERASATMTSTDVKPEAKTAFQTVINTCLNEADYASAMRAVQAQAKATGQADAELIATVNSAWGMALKKANDPAAKEKLLAAATSYSEQATAQPKMAKQHLFKAVTLYKLAGEPKKSLETIDKLLAPMNLDAETTAKLHLDRSELLPSSDFNMVKVSLEAAMTVPGATANTARLKLALLHVNRSQDLSGTTTGLQNPDASKKEAEAIGQFGRDLLKQCADAANVPAESRPAHEQAMFELGRLNLRDGLFTEAEARFKKQLAVYPNGAYAGYGRLWLVCSLLQQHRGDPANKRILEDALTYLKPLTQSTDPYLKTYGEIWTANTMLELGEVAAVLPLTKDLMEKYKGKPEELVAGKLHFYAHLKSATPEPAEASRTLDRMEQVLASLPASVYPNDPEYSQAKWKTELPRLRDELRKFTP
ncbi:hypothetical protein BH11PLA2_BH11PLA2_07560 [soil metagenome]